MENENCLSIPSYVDERHIDSVERSVNRLIGKRNAGGPSASQGICHLTGDKARWEEGQQKMILDACNLDCSLGGSGLVCNAGRTSMLSSTWCGASVRWSCACGRECGFRVNGRRKSRTATESRDEPLVNFTADSRCRELQLV